MKQAAPAKAGDETKKSTPAGSAAVSKSTANLKPLTKEEVKSKKKRTQPRWQRWGKRALLVVGIGLVLCIVLTAAVFAWFARDLPSTDQLESRALIESTKIYDRTGEHLLYETGKDVKRTYVPIDKINDYMKQATVATEDKNFYSHHGFDLFGIVRAAIVDALSSQKHGGSTITQQFVKLAIVGGDKTYTRKIKELILSVELERRYSKDKILEFYLNEASYGGVIVGVEAAAEGYFGVDAADLTLAQSALLASIPQSPTYYTSTAGHDDLYQRKDHALDLMAESGFITKEAAEAAKAEPIELKRIASKKDAPHFVDYVLSKLEDDYGTGFINQGLSVTTTLDYDKQKIAEQAIADGMTQVEKYGGSNAAMVSIDTKTGQVIAMVGSKNYYADDYDGQYNAATSPRQPGSSFKPIVYVTAFANGYNPNTILFDEPTEFGTPSNPYHPTNFGGRISGPITIRTALGQSLNIPAVKALYLVGINKVHDTATSLGYTTLKPVDEYGLSFALGAAEVKLIDHTSTYATFSREGERHPVATILSVKDQTGQTLYEWSDSPSQVLDQAATQQLNSVLSDSSARAGFTSLNISGKTIAGKTGTTNDFKDAWAMMYTPSYATGVWTGNNDNSDMKNLADGVIIAAPIVKDYMSKILDGLPNETFNAPPAAKANKPVLQGKIGEDVEKDIDKYTGKIIPDNCINTYPAEYKAKKTFKEVHTILYYLDKSDPLGAAPSNPEADPMYTNWEKAVQEWAEGQSDYITEKTTYEDCNLRSADQTPTVTIKTPSDGGRYDTSTFSITWSSNPGTNRSVKKVDYIIDNILVDDTVSSPFATDYRPTTLTSGRHTVTVRVTNDRDNTAEATASFTFTASSTNSNTNGNNNTNGNSNTNKNSNTNSNGNTNGKKK